ncbi:MAG: DUF4198 domain-containing protein [Bryobacteraceae bacterium]|nr:DUF4198 domain-containing protein [Bryobacteraceae bacterium]MDW8377530.1 DUF4198 domain-containing protein [Bryobacterales bacterium]
MTSRSRSVVTRGLVALLLSATPALSHVLYLMPQPFVTEAGAVLKVHFENGDFFPLGGSPVDPARLRNTHLICKSGRVALENFQAGKSRTEATVRTPSSGLGTLTAETLPRFIELAPPKFLSYLKHEHLTHVINWRMKHGESQKPGREQYSKYVKAIVRMGASDGFLPQAGLVVEFVPLTDPYSLRTGDALPVQLIFRGQPASDVAVHAAWLERGKAIYRMVGRTDPQGRISVPIRAAGPHRLHAIIMERCREQDVADWESFWASLTFEIPVVKR